MILCREGSPDSVTGRDIVLFKRVVRYIACRKDPFFRGFRREMVDHDFLGLVGFDQVPDELWGADRPDCRSSYFFLNLDAACFKAFFMSLKAASAPPLKSSHASSPESLSS